MRERRKGRNRRGKRRGNETWKGDGRIREERNEQERGRRGKVERE